MVDRPAPPGGRPASRNSAMQHASRMRSTASRRPDGKAAALRTGRKRRVGRGGGRPARHRPRRARGAGVRGRRAQGAARSPALPTPDVYVLHGLHGGPWPAPTISCAVSCSSSPQSGDAGAAPRHRRGSISMLRTKGSSHQAQRPGDDALRLRRCSRRWGRDRGGRSRGAQRERLRERLPLPPRWR